MNCFFLWKINQDLVCFQTYTAVTDGKRLFNHDFENWVQPLKCKRYLIENLWIASFIASENNITLFEFRASCNFWYLRNYEILVYLCI